MRIANFSANGWSRLGKIDGDTIIDLSVATPDLSTSLVEVLRLGAPALKRIADAKAVAGAGLPLASVKLLAPVPNPSKYLAIGMNYHDHAPESASRSIRQNT